MIMPWPSRGSIGSLLMLHVASNGCSWQNTCMLQSVFLILGGALLLYLGGEWLVRGGATLALRMGLTPLVVGLTVISFGTSSPEFVVSVLAAFRHDSSMSLGNVIGSNICNIGLVLGMAALIRPLKVQVAVIRREAPVMLGVTVLVCVMLWNRGLGRVEGAVLFVLLIFYVLYSILASRHENAVSIEREVRHAAHGRDRTGWISALMVACGVLLLAAGAHLFVKGAVIMALYFEISVFVIGLTVVAVGTSLPELAISLVAAYRGEGDIAIGNAIGSNIFNLLGILGIASLLFGVESYDLSWVDISVMVGLSVLILPVLRTGFILRRWEGGVLLSIYILYMVYLVQQG